VRLPFRHTGNTCIYRFNSRFRGFCLTTVLPFVLLQRSHSKAKEAAQMVRPTVAQPNRALAQSAKFITQVSQRSWMGASSRFEDCGTQWSVLRSIDVSSPLHSKTGKMNCRRDTDKSPELGPGREPVRLADGSWLLLASRRTRPEQSKSLAHHQSASEKGYADLRLKVSRSSASSQSNVVFICGFNPSSEQALMK
jgi:hypothetical protein